MNNERTTTLEVEGKAAEHVPATRAAKAVGRVINGRIAWWNMPPADFTVKLDVDLPTDTMTLQIVAKVGRRKLTAGWKVNQASRGILALLFEQVRKSMEGFAMKKRRAK